jgi:hypothetical protein
MQSYAQTGKRFLYSKPRLTLWGQRWSVLGSGCAAPIDYQKCLCVRLEENTYA